MITRPPRLQVKGGDTTMFDLIFGTSTSRQAREELAAAKHRHRIEARKAQILDRQASRQGFRHNLSGRFWEAITGG